MSEICTESFPNYQFYRNGTFEEVKPKIREILLDWPVIKDINQFYNNLEYDHSFIQWLFPSFYSSRFNMHSFKLTLDERDKMVGSQDVLKNFYKSYKLILRFFGIKIQYINFDEIDDIQIIPDSLPSQNLIPKTTINISNSTLEIQSKENTKKHQKLSITKSQTTLDNFVQINNKFIGQQILQKNKLMFNNPINQSTPKQQKPAIQMNPKPLQTQNHLQIVKSNSETSKLVLVDSQQFEKCCFKNTHNLLRLKRILGSLSVLKHRREAIQFCNFLKQQFSILGKEKVYQEYFSGFEEYYEELPPNQQKKILSGQRYFNGYKECYVDQTLVEKVDISIIQ